MVRSLLSLQLAFSLVTTVFGLAEAARPMTIEDVLQLPSIGAVAISPDGKWVAYVVTRIDFDENKNDSDIWVVPTSGGQPRQLTRHVGTDSSPQWAPDSSWLAFQSDRADKSQVFGIHPGGGESWQVTFSKTGVGGFRISPDGDSISYIATEEKSDEAEEREKKRGRPIVWETPYPDQFSRLWAANLEDGVAASAAQLTSGELNVTSAVWSPDGSQLAFGARPSPVLRTYPEGSVYTVARTGGDPHRVTSFEGGENPVEWSKDYGIIVSGSGRALGTFNNRLWSVPPAGGKPQPLTENFDENAGFVHISKDSLLIEAATGTGRDLYRVPLPPGKRGKVERVTQSGNFHSGFSANRDGSSLAFRTESGDQPPEVVHYRMDSGASRKLSNVFDGFGQYELGGQKVVKWKSGADGEQIEGVLTLPVGYQPGRRVPLLLVIHGGPSGVSSDRFSPRRGAYPVQVFSGQGYAVLQPNYRGSTGYGERFRGLNRGDISGKDWIDIDSGVDYLIKEGVADAEKLGIMGWSFGGHHTFWGITQTARYKAASAGAGANDLISMYSQTDLPGFYHTYLGPKPWEDFELYEERSAYRFVDRVSTPLLIQVGEKDERVPAEQSIQFHLAMKTIGKAPTELIIYPGQPHGVREPRLVRDLLIRNVEWFNRWIPVSQN